MRETEKNSSQDKPVQRAVLLEHMSKEQFPENILLQGRSRMECQYITDLFDRFITGPAEEGREIAELRDEYEAFYEALKQTNINSEQSRKLEDSLFGVAIEAEMQGFIYGFKTFEVLINNWPVSAFSGQQLESLGKGSV
ncbi:MAG: hypothetical protein HFG34_02330 [Eubacterium sp.]|nr:hypothetical protein [Eubacterium sp.]